jgi:hypothetical protein
MYKLQKDVAGYNGFGLPVSDIKYSATLAATTDTTVTVPSTSPMGAPANTSNARFIALIHVTAAASVWFAVNNTAAVPAGASFALTNSELIVGGDYFAREVIGGDVLHFYTAASNVVASVVFYALPAC